ncbi:hypothetical protein FACS1894184_21310 [Clostridia bacterium]|nr:hypothetical protein FACS1894184_21310 [Clostridia bacterium]
MSASLWKEQAYERIRLGDRDPDKRFQVTLGQLASNPQESVSKACANRHQAKAAYRLIANDKLTMDAFVKVQREVAQERARESQTPVVLLIRDTTEFNFTTQKCMEGIGTIGSSENLRGLLMHSALAVTPKGSVLGLLHQHTWVRPAEEFGKKKSHTSRPINEKESNRWLETMDQAQTGPHGDAVYVNLCDREGEIFELFERACIENRCFLCRRIHDRKVSPTDTISSYLASQPVSGIYETQIQRDSHTARSERLARMEVRYGTVTIYRPKNLKSGERSLQALRVQVISAIEIDAPEDEKPIDWELITNLELTSFETAQQLSSGTRSAG